MSAGFLHIPLLRVVSPARLGVSSVFLPYTRIAGLIWLTVCQQALCAGLCFNGLLSAGVSFWGGTGLECLGLGLGARASVTQGVFAVNCSTPPQGWWCPPVQQFA